MGGTHLIGTFWIDSCQMVSRQWGILELAPIDQHWGGTRLLFRIKQILSEPYELMQRVFYSSRAKLYFATNSGAST